MVRSVPQLSDPAHEARGCQPQREGRVRWSAWSGGSSCQSTVRKSILLMVRLFRRAHNSSGVEVTGTAKITAADDSTQAVICTGNV